MIVRSLRWRLVFAMALIIATVVVTAGVFSSITVKLQFDRFLVAERQGALAEARKVVRATADAEEAMRQAYARFNVGSVLLDANGRVLGHHPASVGEYAINVLGPHHLELTRHGVAGFEKIRVMYAPVELSGGRRLFLLPPAGGPNAEPRKFRVAVDRWLVAGLGLAALLAVVVMLTIFRRVFRPVEMLTAGARSLAGGNLATRVDVRGQDEVAELGSAFNSMAEALERNERARRNMVSDVAHELRTPLTSIRVQIEAVQDGVIPADAKLFASIAEDAAALSHLIDDLQQLSLADAGQLRLELQEVSVREVVERAVSGLERQGIVVTRDVPELTVRADARRIVQVVRNLLVNALAHAGTRVTITAGVAGDWVEIRVADDGPGVPEEHAERIFDRFYRADASRSRATGGAGLGLAIVKQLVELHGGRVRYERPAFVISLPRNGVGR